MTTAALQQLPLWNDGAVGGDWRVRRSRRALRLGARVFPDGTVEIVVPASAGARQVTRFVESHRERIERLRQRWPRIEVTFPPERVELPALAESWRCQYRPAETLAPRALREINGELVLNDALHGEALRAALLGWLCERARQALAPQLAALAAHLGVSYQRLQIRRQRTRWGSCSTRGTISLNCCLLFHRPEVVRYLLAHELAHLTHMNHSARFWRLVEQYEPRWREYDRELTRGWRQVPGWALQGAGE
ncbi:MAG: M48 family metallopeptidase [Steroidobacteraceae bacterium]